MPMMLEQSEYCFFLNIFRYNLLIGVDFFRNSMDCTLILTEGDSAKSLAVSGLGVIGRDKYGVYPLKGKLLNVREASHKQIMENKEITELVKILGLTYKKKYETLEDMKSLRYGRLMIMTDQVKSDFTTFCSFGRCLIS